MILTIIGFIILLYIIRIFVERKRKRKKIEVLFVFYSLERMRNEGLDETGRIDFEINQIISKLLTNTRFVKSFRAIEIASNNFTEESKYLKILIKEHTNLEI